MFAVYFGFGPCGRGGCIHTKSCAFILLQVMLLTWTVSKFKDKTSLVHCFHQQNCFSVYNSIATVACLFLLAAQLPAGFLSGESSTPAVSSGGRQDPSGLLGVEVSRCSHFSQPLWSRRAGFLPWSSHLGALTCEGKGTGTGELIFGHGS